MSAGRSFHWPLSRATAGNSMASAAVAAMGSFMKAHLMLGLTTLFGAQRAEPLIRRLAGLRREVAERVAPSGTFYSATGEDVFALNWLMRSIPDPSAIRYLDIGAADPIYLSNTYLLYRRGGSGVLVDPDQRYAKRIKARRPRDVLISAGVRFDERRSAELIQFTNPMLNTFSGDQATATAEASQAWRQAQTVLSRTAVPLLAANDIIREHFSPDQLHFLSIDTEGVNFEILRSIDFSRFAPLVICVERQASIQDHLGVIGPRYELVCQNQDNLIFGRVR
jgi:FkbM family methyltransferase